MKAESRQIKKARWYACPHCHKDHPSVTTLLGVIGSPQLMGWIGKNGTAKLNVYADFVNNLSPEAHDQASRLSVAQWKLTETTAFWKSGAESTQEAADYGTMAHAWLESHLKGVAVDLGALPDPARNAVEAYLKWEKEHHLETIKTEETFYNCKLNYAGTADWLGNLDSELSLGDWKTSSGIFFNYVIQSWGYVLADEIQNAERLYKQIFIGRFGKDGSEDVKIYKRNEFPSIETAREVLTACGVIFSAQQEWDRRFPYKRKP